jgi:hypothetical protein
MRKAGLSHFVPDLNVDRLLVTVDQDGGLAAANRRLRSHFHAMAIWPFTAHFKPRDWKFVSSYSMESTTNFGELDYRL